MKTNVEITRHAVHIRAHRFLIQQMILELQSIRPKIVAEMYERISSDLQAHEEVKTKDLITLDAKVDAHVAELLSGVGLRRL